MSEVAYVDHTRSPTHGTILGLATILCAGTAGCQVNRVASEQRSKPQIVSAVTWKSFREPLRDVQFQVRATLFWSIAAEAFDGHATNQLLRLVGHPLGKDAAVGCPYERWLRLYVRSGESVKPVNWPSDLHGHVKIHGPAAALSFVRLFSSEDTFNRFPEFGFMELSPAEEFWPDCTGIPEACESLTLPEAVKTSTGYRITRLCARVDLRSGNPTGIVIMDEEIDADGGYALRILWEDADRERLRRLLLPF